MTLREDVAVGWEALDQWDGDVARIEALTGGVGVNEVWSVRVNGQLAVGRLGWRSDADRIFQPFQRLNQRASHDGFGLGLTIVASIAAVHGGDAAAHPRHGGGLSIIVTIPSAASPGHDTGREETGRSAVAR